MALVRFGSTISEIRGSINGATFSRNRAGAIIRNRITPINPNTMSQAQIRYLFSYVASQWASLNQNQKTQWNDYAKTLTFWVNRLGESYTPSGRQVFQYCNINLILSGTTITGSPGAYNYVFPLSQIIKQPIAEATEKPAPPQFANNDFTFAASINPIGGTITSFVSNENAIAPAVGDKNTFIIEATLAMRPTVTNRNNKYKFLSAFSISSGSPVDITSRYNLVLPQSGLQTGQSIYLRLSTVNNGGLRSDPLEVEVVL